MICSITSIELKGPLKFFALSARALKIVQQLKGTKHLDYKSRGFWTKHYTMSLWENEEDLKNFAKSGAHLEAMKISKDIAKEIRILSLERDKLPSWDEAKKLLENGKIYSYS
tara:strand:+ start:953 stop:1288 length:336 start_codon:yes stop_codon:yes gene_type:complete